MGVTVKDVGILVWKVFKFTVKILYYCTSKYPFISCILLFFFLLYMFLPSVFIFFIYFSPLVLFAGVVHRIFLQVDRRKKVEVSKQNEKKNDGISSTNLSYVENELAVDTNGSFSAGTTRRRIVKEECKEDDALSRVEDKGTVFSRSFDNDTVDKNALTEEDPKEIREVKVDSVIDRVEDSSSISHGSCEDYQKSRNRKSETERECPDDDTEDEEEEREKRNKAVEWTADDQKNLMDLGLSEIERNKRLESLIARRRSRKHMIVDDSMTMETNSYNPQISSLQIPKTNPFLVNSSNHQFSPVPGSAPSVLLPTSNPFDLPYDPFEEKPNLTGGSFHQEFMVTNQKEMVFCRHESFHMSAFLPPDFKNDKHVSAFLPPDYFSKQNVFEKPPLATLDSRQDGKQIQQEFPPVADPMSKDDTDSNQGKENIASEQVADSVDRQNEDEESDVQTKEMVVDDSSSDTSSSSSAEPIFRPNKEAILNSIRQLSRRHIVVDKEITSQTKSNNDSFDSSSSDFTKRKAEGQFFLSNMDMLHTPSHSIASDMQVEVSDIGSPPSTNISSQDEASSTNDGDMEKEITTESEEIWAASSHLSGVDKNEPRYREGQELSEQEIMDVELSDVDQNSNPLASHVFAEKVIEQDTIDSNLLSPSKPEGVQHCKTDSNQSFIEKDLSSIAPDSFEVSSSEALTVPVPEKEQKMTGEFEATPSHYVDPVKPEESYGPKKFEKEMKTRNDMSNPEVRVENDNEDSTTAVTVSSIAQALIQNENTGNLSNHPIETNTLSSESEAQVDKQIEGKYSIDSSKPHEKEDVSTSLEHDEEGVDKLVQPKDVFLMSETSSNSEGPIQNREVDHSISEPGSLGVRQGLVDPDASVSQNEVSTDRSSGDDMASSMALQIGAEPSLSSPKSVLQPTFSIDQAASTNSGEEIYTVAPRSESVIREIHSMQQPELETSVSLAPSEDEGHLTDISRDGPSPVRDSISNEDSVHSLVTSPNEVSRMSMDHESEENKCEGDSQITSIVEATAELLRPGNETDSIDTEGKMKEVTETISPDHQLLSADQSSNDVFTVTREEEQIYPPSDWSNEEFTINPTAYDSEIEIGENGTKSIGGDSECPSESITRQSSVHHHFSQSSEDFIQDLFSSLVPRSASVTRQSSVHEFSRSSEDFLQDLFKSLVSDAGAASNRVSRQGSMLESVESTDDMIQDLFKSLQDNPRE